MRAISPWFVAALFGVVSSSAVAAPISIEVTNTSDSGPGSLRQAIIAVNASRGGTILLSKVSGTILLSNELPVITANAIIRAPGTNLSISGGGRTRILTTAPGSSNTVVGLSITSGSVTNSNGGGISNAGTLRLVDCAITACSSEGGFGGGIYNSGKLFIDRSVLSGNISRGIDGFGTNESTYRAGGPANGGAIFVDGGVAVISDSVLAENRAQAGFGSWYLRFTDSGLPGGAASGGGIFVSNGVLRLSGCMFNHNQALGGRGGFSGSASGGNGGGARGGGVAAYSSFIDLVASQLSDNGAAGGAGAQGRFPGYGGGVAGGGIYADATPLNITNSTLSSNFIIGGAGGGGPGNAHGGGIATRFGTLTLVGCTLSANVAQGGTGGANSGYPFPPPCPYACGGIAEGGGIRTDATNTFLLNSTVAGNISVGGIGGGGTCPPCNGISEGGGVHAALGLTNVRGLLVAGNSALRSPDVFGAVGSRGYNLVGQTNGTIGWTTSDLQNIDAHIGPLQDNGGPVFTHALLAGSPAIDAGLNQGDVFDARGQPRTIDNPAVNNAPGGDGTDIGAFEVNHILASTEVRTSGDDILVRFTTVSDKTYGVESRAEIEGGPWTKLPGNVIGTGGIVTYRDIGAASLPRRFYRVFQNGP